LSRIGCQVIQLAEEPDLPDSVFVEDVALVFPEVAILTYPGADSRLPERESIREALTRWRTIREVSFPARLDGGDVLVLGQEVFVGMSSRSNPAAVDALHDILGEFNYQVMGVTLRDCLHLKSAVTRVGLESLLINSSWIDPGTFSGWRRIEVAAGEDYAANALWIDDAVIYSTAFPKTAERLRGNDITLKLVDLSELQKAEGAVTCCSLVFPP
jgi:dimethylargininase